MIARVQNNGKRFGPFPWTNGVKQGCVLPSMLFSMMFSAMRIEVFQDGNNHIPIRYRFDGKLFNLRMLQAKFNVQAEVLDEFLLSDDMANGLQQQRRCTQVCIMRQIYVKAMISQST